MKYKSFFVEYESSKNQFHQKQRLEAKHKVKGKKGSIYSSVQYTEHSWLGRDIKPEVGGKRED